MRKKNEKGAKALRIQKAVSYHTMQRSNASSRFANGV
jgi:hypothetical protein